MSAEKQQIDSDFLKLIEERLTKMKRTANWTGGSLIAMGVLAIGCSLFITAFAGELEVIVIKIIAFASTLFITLIGAFNLSSKANEVRNGWKHLNKAFIGFKAQIVDAATLIKAYEDSENMLGNVEFNYKQKEV
jgi:FtsH-binding integral membrane protein